MRHLRVEKFVSIRDVAGVGSRSRDTKPDAEAMQFELYRRMSGVQRTQLGEQMSIDAREVALGGIRARHPEYDEARGSNSPVVAP